MKAILKILIVLIVLSGQALAQECFYPAHNMVGYSDLLTSSTGWNQAGATIIDDTGSTTPPEALETDKTFKLTGTAAAVFLISGQTGNKFVVNSAGYYLSIYAKYSNLQWIRFGTTGGSTYACNFDIQNGAVGTCTGLSDATITLVGDGWYYLRAYYAGATSVSNAFRLRVEGATSSSSGAATNAGTEIVYLSSPQAQDDAVTSPEYKKYVVTSDFNRVWSTPRPCDIQLRDDAITGDKIAAAAIGPTEIATDTFDADALATDAVNEVREGILTRVVEGNYGATTIGGYIERIKNYVANKMVKSGSTYTIYKNDESTTYATGTTNGAGRDPS